MKIPGIKMIKSLYYANRPLRKAVYKDNVIIKELDGYFEQIIGEEHAKINDYAARAGLKLKLAQEGDLLLINSGSNTSFIDKREIKNVNDIFNTIKDNIDKTMNDILKSGQ